MAKMDTDDKSAEETKDKKGEPAKEGESKPEDKPETKPAAKDMPKDKPADPPKPKAKAKAEPKAKPKAESKAKPKAEPKAKPKAKAGPKAAAKPAKAGALPEDKKKAADGKAPAKAAPKAEPKAAPKAAAKPANKFVPPKRSRHPQPALEPSSSRRFYAVVIIAVAAILLILSFAYSRTYRIVDMDGQAIIEKGQFLPFGFKAATPTGAPEAFKPVPWITPPQGASTQGGLETIADSYYAMIYLAAGDAQDAAELFDTLDQQATSMEAWFNTRYNRTPEALGQMSDLRSRVRYRRQATKEYKAKRDQVLDDVVELVGMLPDRAGNVLEQDADLFRQLLRDAAASDLGGPTPPAVEVPAPAPAPVAPVTEEPAAVVPTP